MAKANQSFVLKYKGINNQGCRRLGISKQRYKNMLDGNCFLSKRNLFLVGKSSGFRWKSDHSSGDIWDMQKVHKKWKISLINEKYWNALRIVKSQVELAQGEKTESILHPLKKFWKIREINIPWWIVYSHYIMGWIRLERKYQKHLSSPFLPKYTAAFLKKVDVGM